ncbi:MAG TPA: alpha/beta hydrolase domain-containing protein [Vicinamibacterales bacterium]|nr:alpha/beta hydrolase domain-containing protein [Vicinamibacterales bacterium]
MRNSAIALGVAAAIALTGAAKMRAESTSCDNLLPPKREVRSQKVGPASCLMQDADITYDGRAYKRVDVGLDGTVDGFAAKVGDYKDYLTNGPDLVFPQTWGPRQILFAVAKYERAKGASMTIVHPADAAAWNGRIFVTVHGRGRSFKQGNLKAWDRNFNPAAPLGDLDRYERLMVAKGYAVVKTNRTSSEGLGEITATLEDGSTVDSVAFNDTARYIMDFAEVARALLAQRLGRAPAHVYMYGHSAGARIGHSINYTPGLNVGRDGRRFFDGLLLDDPAAGTWYPVVMKDGKDVLLTSAAEKAAFVPQIDVAHQMYNNIWPPQHPAWMSSSYLENKRNNARILRDKGIANYRMYEVRGTSHSGGESLPDSMQRGELQNIDVSKAMDRFIDLLDAWVDKGTAPPPTHSDDPSLGGAGADGAAAHPALAFPELACPLGVYYGYPGSTAGATAFAAFTGSGIEPLDGNDVFVDMNRNGVWDYRETPTQAWRRLGLLKGGESLTREAYASCVTTAANRLRDEGFFSPKTAAAYADQAKTTDLQPKQNTAVVIHKKKAEGG